jgi:hypothetical protein
MKSNKIILRDNILKQTNEDVWIVAPEKVHDQVANQLWYPLWENVRKFTIDPISDNINRNW